MPGAAETAAGAFSAGSGETGVLVLHGFTGVPFSVRPLALAIAGAGFFVDVPLLPGHASSVEDLAQTGYSDWKGAARAAYDRLAARSSNVFIAGLSLGGTLALDLASEVAVSGLVVVNPYVVPPAESFLEMMRKALDQGVQVIPSIGSDIAAKETSSRGYDGTPVAALLSLFDGAKSLYGRLSSITVPTLLCSSRVDHVVPIESGDALVERLGGPVERVMLENSYHVATLDYDAPLLEARAIEFCKARVAALSGRH